MKKKGAKFLLSALTFIVVGSSVFYVQPAKAQLPVTITSNIPETAFKVRDLIKDGFKNAVINIAIQSFSYFMRRVSYDTAVYLASGGKGQSPLAHYKDFGSYMDDVKDNMFGVAIEALGAPYGLNLCKIPDPKIDLAMRIGLTKKYLDASAGMNSQTDAEGVRKPDCNWTTFSKDVWNKDNWESQFGSKADIAKKFNIAFSVEQTDVGIFMGATKKLDDIVAKATEAAKLQRQEGNGSIGTKKLISNEFTNTPGDNAKLRESINPAEQKKEAEEGFKTAILSGGTATIAGAGSLFLNTLASQMLKNFQTKGMFPFGICAGKYGDASCNVKNVQDTLTNFEGQVSRGGRQAAQALFSDLLTPPNIATDDYNILSNFTNCPANAGPDNCVADAGLAQAAQESNSEKPITIADALEKNWLHGEWKLISPERSADNTDPTCHQHAYCYSNLAKLRKARVLPLGFEIAALNSNPDKPWTLKQVVDGFNDCNFIFNTSSVVVGINNDPVNKPFCHLIDPNWVIKAPLSKCNFMAYGASPYVAGTPNRTQECVDMTSCVAYDKDGNCATQGYCTREKNVWKIDAAKCDAENRTCRTFQDSTGKDVSYLYRTLDTGYCTQETVGCSQYSLKQNSLGNWSGYSRSDLDFGENSVIHFNNKVSTNCSANSDGCSSFQTVENSDQLYLRKAPNYLGCYDTDQNTPATDWPQTVSDLNRLTPTTTCNNYAQPCIADEVSCNWYSPVSYAGDNIPGKFTPAKLLEDGIVWNDQCDQRCAGYAAYREMPSNYAGGKPLDYIIPSSGSSCNAIDEGCSSFTNLATTENGLEKVEYFSYLRPCILPDTTKQKTFYTYEGSEVGGFQLKGFILEKDTDGSPKYFYRTDTDKDAYNAICSESLYKQGLASPDCRQFNDDKGAVYYRLLSKTIAVAQSCKPYRLNDTELYAINLDQVKCAEQKGKWDGSSCQVCFQNGEYRDGQCFYYGLPGGTPNTAGMSKTCSASANTCRAYKGNAGNNVRNVFSDNFEGTDVLADWGPLASVSQSLESTHNGEHSLSYNGNDGVYKNLILTPGESYDIIFWAKGLAGTEDVSVTLENDNVVELGTISVSDVWQSYHLGPIALGGSSSTVKLKFSINGRLFLDNIHLKQVADYLYLVKNTLNVDSVCDSNINDNLPGEALGCSQYRNPDNQSLYLTKFTSLCREKAIGCTALYDTHNTPDDVGSRAYNVWFSGASGQIVTKNIDGREYSCRIAVGQSGCYTDITGASTTTIIAGGGTIVTSTVYIPADTATSTPVYLVANKEATCNVLDLGCSKAGKLTQTLSGPTYSTVLIKQDPATYSNTLCQSEAVGCSSYNSSDGVLYFKDPTTVGQKICSYRGDVSKDGISYKGWFWKGVGRCGLQADGNYCAQDTDCGAGGVCNKRDEQPCYPDYLQSGNNYGLWSYGVASAYKNFVGECPSTQSGCTEFVDHNENNKPYYIISDEHLKSRQTECNGEISEKAGCILLDRTDQPNKLWNTSDSYKLSASLNNNLAKPVVSATNDANVIMKVNRDRECGEWLQCRSSHRVFDQQLGNYKEICDDIGRCNKAGAAGEAGIINCANWIDDTGEVKNQVLNDNIYRNRSTDWKGQDFSGFSLLNIFPIEELSEINAGSGLTNDWRLAKPLPCGGSQGENCKSNTNLDSPACLIPGTSCGRRSAGMCLGATNSVCVQNFDGSADNSNSRFIKSSCRAYPEETSPFPNTQSLVNSLPYGSVNLCNEANERFTEDLDKANSCDCSYTKVLYGDSTIKYWNFNKPNKDGIANKNSALITGVVSGLCLGGESEGKVCSKDQDCVRGSCQKQKNESRLIGWQGYCVEPDLSRPLNAEQNKFACLTWFPKDNISGSLDINNQHVEAGFQAATAGGKYYCLGAKGNQLDHGPNYQSDGLGWANRLNYTKLLIHFVDQNGRPGLWKSSGIDTDRETRVLYAAPEDQFFRDEIDYIAFATNNDPQWGYNGHWFPSSPGRFFIRNGLLTKYNGADWSVIKKDGEAVSQPQFLINETRAMPFGKYVWSDGRGDKNWILRWDNGLGDGANNRQYADPEGAQFQDLLVWNFDRNGRDDFQDNYLHQDIDDADSGVAIRVLFDDNNKLNKINIVGFTGDSDRDVVADIRIYVGLREPCIHIAQTEAEPYTAVGRTNVLWDKNPEGDLPGTIYRRSLPNSPFASLGLVSDLSATDLLVNVFSVYNNSTFDTLPAVGGAPYSCQGNCLNANSINPAPENVRMDLVSNHNIPIGKNYLATIFAKINSVWNWDLNNGSWSYQENTSTGFTGGYNFTETGTDLTRAPKVLPLGICSNGDKCQEGTSPGLTVNGKSSGDLIFPTDVAKVNLKFFGYADKDQMPIRKVKVNWGDGIIVDLDGYFRNQRGEVNVSGKCIKEAGKPDKTCHLDVGHVDGQNVTLYDFDANKKCVSDRDCAYMSGCFPANNAPNFGQIENKTCDNNYFKFDHVYQCFRGGDGWTPTCSNQQMQTLYGGCCEYTPAVQLKDNWGWCNGQCGTFFTVGKGGCYDAGWQPIQENECLSNNAYTRSSVRIIVAPE
jgi:hypothetical protein